MNHLPIPRAQSTTDMINRAWEEQREIEARAAMLDAICKARIHGTGEFRKLLDKATADYQGPARARIQQRRRET